MLLKLDLISPSAELTVFFRLFIPLDTADLISDMAFVTMVLIFDQLVLVLLLIAAYVLAMVFLMTLIAVETLFFIVVRDEVTVLPMPLYLLVVLLLTDSQEESIADLTADAPLVTLDCMAVHCVFRLPDTALRAVFADFSTDFQTLSRASCTPDAPFDTALWMSFYAVLMLVLMLSHAVFAPVCMEVQAAAIVLSSAAMPEVTVDWMLVQELEIVVDIPFQELCTSAATLVHALSMLVLTCWVEESVLPVVASQMPPKKPEMPSHADLAAAEMLSHAVHRGRCSSS